MSILRHTDSRNLDLREGLPAFLLGFLATSFQIYLLREFVVHFYGNELTFGFVLAAWLFWSGVGSLTAPYLLLRSERLPFYYAASLFLFLFCLAVLRFSRVIMNRLPTEVTGLVPALVFSLVLAFLLSFPLGLFFVVNSRLLEGDVSRVYLLEALGATAGALAVHFILIPTFSNWAGCGILVAASALLLVSWAGLSKQGRLWIFAGAAALSVTFILLDIPSQKALWRPFKLIATKDTPYGKMHVIRRDEQISFYSNGLLISSHPDLGAAEESVHFALLQNPEAREVLLIGGGTGGACGEILKYPLIHCDYVEIDPSVIRLSRRYSPEEIQDALKDPRIRIIHEDGRAYVARTEKLYDAILLDLPAPATAQLNRFYTLEFFLLVRERLRPAGVFSFSLPSAENYISPELQEFLGILYGTLKKVFPEVLAVPGNTNIFLSSASKLSIDPEDLEEEIERWGLKNRYVTQGMLSARLNPLRVDDLSQKMIKSTPRINHDLRPVSYYFHSVLWASQFRGVEAAALQFLASVPSYWILKIPLVFFGLLLLGMGLGLRTSPFRYLLPLAILGFSTILVEIAILIIYQASFGYVYGKIAFLLAAFMAGLFLGSMALIRRKKASVVDLLALEGGFLILLLFIAETTAATVSEIAPFLALLAAGFAGGALFITANRLFLRERRQLGLGYGIELLGSFLGVLLASSIIIPLFGVAALLKALIQLNILVVIFIVLLLFREKAR